jgi:hypothetical protein
VFGAQEVDRPDRDPVRLVGRQAIGGSTCTSVKVLINQIRDYIAHWNIHPQPVAWTTTDDAIPTKFTLPRSNTEKLVDNNRKLDVSKACRSASPSPVR